jgi:hypothetical protein
VGLHDPDSERMKDHFSPHCARHWNTIDLLREGMKRDYVQWLRGDAIKEAVYIYFHVGLKDVQEAYLATIPQLRFKGRFSEAENRWQIWERADDMADKNRAQGKSKKAMTKKTRLKQKKVKS